MNKNIKNFLIGVLFFVAVITAAFLTNGFGDSEIFLFFLQIPILNFFNKILIWFCDIFNSYKCSAFIMYDNGKVLMAMALDFFMLSVWYGFIFMIIGKLFSWVKIRYIKK